MAISLQTENPDTALLTAIQDAAWDLNTTTVVQDYYLVEISNSSRQHWQVALNQETGEAAVKRLDAAGDIFWVKATSVADAVLQASRAASTK